ncbi:unnamed protein product [Coregonus sp. 'balchen']|nr:unnamed protein product [Coregonus sp. 'balchen']
MLQGYILQVLKASHLLQHHMLQGLILQDTSCTNTSNMYNYYANTSITDTSCPDTSNADTSCLDSSCTDKTVPSQGQEERLEAVPVAVATPRKQKIWGDEAQAAVRRQLEDFTKLMKIPGETECDACIAAEPALQGRTWKDVKNYVHNTLMTMCRRHISGKQNMDHEKPSPVTQKPGVQQKPGVPLGLPEDLPVYLYL